MTTEVTFAKKMPCTNTAIISGVAVRIGHGKGNYREVNCLHRGRVAHNQTAFMIKHFHEHEYVLCQNECGFSCQQVLQ